MRISRRQFIKAGITGIAGTVILNTGWLNVSRASDGMAGTGTELLSDSTPEAHHWRFIVDIRKCIGCGHCVKACKSENSVPVEPEFNRTWVERYVITEKEEVYVDSPNGGIDGFKADYVNAKYEKLNIGKSFFVPKLCNHCEKPPCVPVCPVGATYANDEGVVLVNRNACIGCRYCIQACPFGARFFDPRYRVVDKCTWCYHRITKGLLPACVEACPTGARMFGSMLEPESSVSRVIREETLGILKPEIGCGNKVYYVGLEKGVR